jgi:hypothetical protein
VYCKALCGKDGSSVQVAVNGMTCDGFTVTLLSLMECARQSKYCDEMSTERMEER